MVDSKRYQDWLQRSQQDLEAAKVILDSEIELYHIVAFHAQQCVEKAYKAYLYFKGASSRSHDLAELNSKCRAFDQGFNEFFDSSAELDAYYIETRYPADFPLNISKKEAENCVISAKEILMFIKKKIGENVT